GNYAEGMLIGAPNITGGYSNVVSTLELGQPAPGPAGTSCSAALDIGMPNQSGNCVPGSNRVGSIYNGSSNSSCFAANVGLREPLPTHPIQTGAGAYIKNGGIWTKAYIS